MAVQIVLPVTGVPRKRHPRATKVNKTPRTPSGQALGMSEPNLPPICASEPTPRSLLHCGDGPEAPPKIDRLSSADQSSAGRPTGRGGYGRGSPSHLLMQAAAGLERDAAQTPFSRMSSRPIIGERYRERPGLQFVERRRQRDPRSGGKNRPRMSAAACPGGMRKQTSEVSGVGLPSEVYPEVFTGPGETPGRGPSVDRRDE